MNVISPSRGLCADNVYRSIDLYAFKATHIKTTAQNYCINTHGGADQGFSDCGFESAICRGEWGLGLGNQNLIAVPEKSNYSPIVFLYCNFS